MYGVQSLLRVTGSYPREGGVPTRPGFFAVGVDVAVGEMGVSVTIAVGGIGEVVSVGRTGVAVGGTGDGEADSPLPQLVIRIKMISVVIDPFLYGCWQDGGVIGEIIGMQIISAWFSIN
jgi:hypothetical protein